MSPIYTSYASCLLYLMRLCPLGKGQPGICNTSYQTYMEHVIWGVYGIWNMQQRIWNMKRIRNMECETCMDGIHVCTKHDHARNMECETCMYGIWNVKRVWNEKYETCMEYVTCNVYGMCDEVCVLRKGLPGIWNMAHETYTEHGIWNTCGIWNIQRIWNVKHVRNMEYETHGICAVQHIC